MVDKDLKEQLIKIIIESEKEVEILPSDEDILELKFKTKEDCRKFTDRMVSVLDKSCKGEDLVASVNLIGTDIYKIILLDEVKKSLFFINDNRVNSTSILCKATNDCNLHCKYCYDYPMRIRANHAKLSFEDIDKLLNMLTDYAQNIIWIWHGGEPLVMGLDWYKRVQTIFDKYAWKSNIAQEMQSNGTLINDDWIEFLKTNRIRLGVSFDVFGQGARVGSRMVQVSDILKKAVDMNLPLGTITVISAENCKKQIEAYEYLKSIGEKNAAFNYIFATEETSKNKDIIMSFEDTVNEFLRFYNYWIHDTNGEIPERTCEVITEHVFNLPVSLCNNVDCRYAWLGVNGNKEIYPCDRLLPDSMRVGSLDDFSSIKEMYLSDGYKNFVKAVEDRMQTRCSKCPYVVYCHGGCCSNHITSPSGKGYDEQYCREFKAKFNGVYNIIRDVNLFKDIDKLSKIFVNKLIVQNRYTPREIKECLEEQGFDISGIKYDKNNVTECSEFKLFLIVNNFSIDIFDGKSESDLYRRKEHLINIIYRNIKAIRELGIVNE